ncbi:hypothetical protein ABM016_19225 [Morganella morganii]|uniref:hypothetical protein n=1 Tax=Morganella morganii TaxID=582 RepID=UPI003EC07318
MNPFFSKRFLILTFFFALSLLLMRFVYRGNTEDWQWKNHNENSVAVGSYDFAKTFLSEKGMLIITQKRSSSSYYSYSPHENLSQYNYQILFADDRGVHFITNGTQRFYNAACERNECLIILKDGYRTINLSNFSENELIPWGDRPRSLFSTLIMGKIYQSKDSPFYVVADNENIFISIDKGITWEHFMNVRELTKSLFPEEIDSDSNFCYATYRDKIVMWYSYGKQMRSLEVILDIPTKQVISHKWLPVRINESAQNHHGDIFVVAQELSRRLFSLMQFHTDGNFEVITENGYNHLNSLKVGNQGVIVSNSVRGSQQYLMMDIATKEIRYRPELPLYNKIYNMADQSLIEIESTYSNEDKLTKGAQVSFQSLH